MKILNSFLLISLSFFIVNCKKDPLLPATKTSISGTLVDENNSPVEGISFAFFGMKHRGFKPSITIFDVSSTTNDKGEFHLEYQVESSANYLLFTMESVILGYEYYSIDKNNKLKPFPAIEDGVSPKNTIIKLGTNNTFNLKRIKL